MMRLAAATSWRRLLSSRVLPPYLSNWVQKIPAPAILVEAGSPEADLAGAAFEAGAECTMLALSRLAGQHQPLGLARPAAECLKDGEHGFRPAALDLAGHPRPQAVAVLHVLR